MTEQIQEPAPPRKITAGFLIGWAWAVLAGVPGIMIMLEGHIMGGLFFVLSALAGFPPVHQLISTRLHIVFSGVVKVIGAVIFAGIAGSILGPAPATTPDANQPTETSGQVAAPAKDPSYQDIDLTDLKLDKETLVGRRVRVSGLYQQMGDQGIIASELGDMTPIWLDISNVPRDQRKDLLDCPNRQCTFTFEGVVTRFPLGIEVVAYTAAKQ